VRFAPDWEVSWSQITVSSDGRHLSCALGTEPTHPYPLGAQDVEVETSGGIAILRGGFTFTPILVRAPSPVVHYCQPPVGPFDGGNTVTIGGEHLSGATEVTFAGTPASKVFVEQDYWLRCVVPPGPDGPVRIEVTTPSGTAGMSGAYSYDRLHRSPWLAGLAPWLVPEVGHCPVQIRGSNLSRATAAAIGGVDAEIIDALDDGTIVVMAPPEQADTTVSVTTPENTITTQPGWIGWLPVC
jgi:hypothetical protein